MTAVGLRPAFVFLAVVAATAALAGCGSSSKTATDAGLSLDVRIAHGQVTPANATLQATVRQPITLHVTSDAADKFEVAAAANQTFQFSVEVPGNVDVELHHLDRTVATIQVRP
jgi:hypothetical protein